MNNIKAKLTKICGMYLKPAVPILFVLSLICVLIPAGDIYAGVKIAFNEDEYNIYTEDYPDLISDNIYGKFTSSVSDPDSYKLNFVSDDALVPFANALKKKNISYKEDFYTAFEISMWQETDDDDKQVYKSASVYVPLPDDAQEYPDYCTFYKVSGGTASVVPTKVYTDEDDINYVQIILSGKTDYTTLYGFVFADPSDLEEEEEEEEEEEDEEEEEEDDEEEESAPTKAPTKTPTKAPDKTPTKSANATPTKSGSKDDSSGSKPARKDNSPKTGDEMDFVTLGITGLGAAGVLTTSILLQVKGRKKKKDKSEGNHEEND